MLGLVNRFPALPMSAWKHWQLRGSRQNYAQILMSEYDSPPKETGAPGRNGCCCAEEGLPQEETGASYKTRKGSDQKIRRN